MVKTREAKPQTNKKQEARIKPSVFVHPKLDSSPFLRGQVCNDK